MTDDQKREIQELREKTASIRHQFLWTEIQTLEHALDMGHIELKSGELGITEKEIGVVERGCETIRHFLPKLEPDAQPAVQKGLEGIELRLIRLKADYALRRQA
jgi:hypothetical protein